MLRLGQLLQHPASRGLDLDDPATTAVRRQIVRSKPFLKHVYDEWYDLIVASLDGRRDVLELGAGGGFLADRIPSLITSDVFEVPGVDLILDARRLDVEADSLDAIVMTNVFHHVPDAGAFLSEAQRTLRSGGRVVMVEPWNTPWSRWVHRKLHHEPMLPEAQEWEFPDAGPLSGANAALPWIVFERDRDQLNAGWPELRVVEIRPLMPFSYLASGGVSLRSLQPGWAYPLWRMVETTTLEQSQALFALIVLERS